MPRMQWSMRAWMLLNKRLDSQMSRMKFESR